MDPSPAVPPSSPLAAAAAFVARQRVAIEEVLSRSSAPTGEDLHDLRVALRRAAAAAEFTRGHPVVGRAGLRRAARRLRKSLSDQRTAEVSAELLVKRFSHGTLRRDVVLLRAALVAGPATAAPAATSSPAARPGDAAGESARRLGALRRAFARREAALAIAATREGADELFFEHLVGKLEKRRSRLVREGPPDEEALHPFRIRARDLRYGFELFAPAWPPSHEAVQALRELQEAAGDAHDLFELRRALETLAAPGAGRGRAAASRLLPRVLSAEGRALAATRRVALAALGLLDSLELPQGAPGRVS